MKRHVALHGLSEDHHHGLVLARRCASAAGDSSAAAATAALEELRRVFAHELEPHFRCEEELILPTLIGPGAPSWSVGPRPITLSCAAWSEWRLTIHGMPSRVLPSFLPAIFASRSASCSMPPRSY